ncbi:MAG: type I glutamate--ammonia ligase [Gemmatimonadota bacterium]|jgi:glutamine synthetase|nr:MAG: type I glutamate--ammonia ligase [Gemmatimonadota bacterium]
MSADSIFAAPAEHAEETRYSRYGRDLGPDPDPKGVLELCRALNVRFLRLTFTDILGQTKNVEVPASQFPKALDGEILFDGSSIQGFVRIEESDMLLKPDLRTFRVFPWGNPEARVGRLICDVYHPDESPFEGDPRLALKRVVASAAELGYQMMAGVEAEFFLFQRNGNGEPTTVTHDHGGYFDLTPVDLGEKTRRLIINDLEAMGFEVEAGHHEVAPGQHEIDFKYADALTTADDLATFRFIVRNAAMAHGLHATFMPKPIFGQNGSGMHTHQSLFRDGENAFFDPEGEYQISDAMRHYIGGLKQHARAIAAITNPIVNSYKRLVPGYEAPVNIAWSRRNRSPLIRVPERRGAGTRVEFRMPDPSCNPYLALAVQLAAGLDGLRNRIDPGPPVDTNVWQLSEEERRRYQMESLPANLKEAVDELAADEVLGAALGDHILHNFVDAKRKEWGEYIAQVTDWELQAYLAAY